MHQRPSSLFMHRFYQTPACRLRLDRCTGTLWTDMPELPEVETVRRGLAPMMEGARFAKVEQRRPDLRFPFPKDFARRLKGRRVERLERRAKYLIARLDDGALLAMHLGMSGRFTIASGAGQGA